jgi:hypothetical protein
VRENSPVPPRLVVNLPARLALETGATRVITVASQSLPMAVNSVPDTPQWPLALQYPSVACRETRMPPAEELVDQPFGDGVVLDKAGEKALAEQLHDRVRVPCLEWMKGAVLRERSVGHEDVTVGMPLQEVAAGGDGDHDAGPRVRSNLCSQLLGEGLRAALREVEQKLPPLPEDSAQEARHGEDDMTMRDVLEHLFGVATPPTGAASRHPDTPRGINGVHCDR